MSAHARMDGRFRVGCGCARLASCTRSNRLAWLAVSVALVWTASPAHAEDFLGVRAPAKSVRLSGALGWLDGRPRELQRESHPFAGYRVPFLQVAEDLATLAYQELRGHSTIARRQQISVETSALGALSLVFDVYAKVRAGQLSFMPVVGVDARSGRFAGLAVQLANF